MANVFGSEHYILRQKVGLRERITNRSLPWERYSETVLEELKRVCDALERGVVFKGNLNELGGKDKTIGIDTSEMLPLVKRIQGRSSVETLPAAVNLGLLWSCELPMRGFNITTEECWKRLQEFYGDSPDEVVLSAVFELFLGMPQKEVQHHLIQLQLLGKAKLRRVERGGVEGYSFWKNQGGKWGYYHTVRLIPEKSDRVERIATP